MPEVNTKGKKLLVFVFAEFVIYMHRRNVQVSTPYSFRIISWNLIIVPPSYQENTLMK